MESPLARLPQYNSGALGSDADSKLEITSPTQQLNFTKNNTKPKVAEPNIDKSETPAATKSKYRIGQVVDEEEDSFKTKVQAKLVTKPPVVDPEPEKNKRNDSGLLTGRSEKDAKVNLSDFGQKSKKVNDSQVSWPLESGRGTYETYEKMMDSKDGPQTISEIEAENKLLRQFLKDLNEQLKHHVERAKITNYEGKKTEFKDKSPEEQIKTIIRELANNEKILAYNKEEHKKAETRLNMLKDPSYVFNIQKEIMSVQSSIDALKKENKMLNLKTGNVGKDLDVIENVKGMPGSLEKTHESEKESLKFSQKLDTLKQKNADCVEEKKRKLEKEKTLSEKIRKLERSYFGDSYVSEETLQKRDKIAKKLAMAEEDLRLAQNKCKFKTTQVARDLEELYVQHQKEREHVEKLDDVLRDQAQALKDLISTEGSRMNRGAQEVLDQIRTSLEHEERQKRVAPGNLEPVRSPKDSNFKLQKNRSIDGVKLKTEIEQPHLNYSSTSKHKYAIKRELEEKKPVWKESNNGERARMEENLGISPVKTKKIEEQSQFTKPIKPVKASKESDEEEVQHGKKQKEQAPVVKETPKQKSDQIEHKQNDGDNQKALKNKNKLEDIDHAKESPREIKIKNKSEAPEKEKIQFDISPKPLEQEKKDADKQEDTKRKKDKKKEGEDNDDDVGKLKEEINQYSSQIAKEVKNKDQKDKNQEPEKEKKKKKEDAFDDINFDDEPAGKPQKEKVFDLGAKAERADKAEKDKSNLKLDLNKPNKAELAPANEELPTKSKRDGEPKKKEDGEPKKKEDGEPKKKEDGEPKKKEAADTDTKKAKINESPQKPKENAVVEEPVKSKREGEPKRKEVGDSDTKRKKVADNLTGEKEVEEWDFSDNFEDKNQKRLKPMPIVKDIKKPKETKPKQDDEEFEEINFDD